ncbi:MAG: nucleotidyltransferase domain-containing protein [Clostridiales bacterium]|nr:nucleotidyltransferase domain-containing protein [Clostridiales bacterium]
MVDIQHYLSRLTHLLQERFGSRLLYVGLQGSYLRGEATDTSDIDIMAVIDELSASDLAAYRAVIQSMEYFELSCGFICSKLDLACWNPLEICHVLHTTKDFYGTLKDLIPSYSRQDVQNFVKMSLNNLYHEICHRYIHAGPERSREALPATYKGVFFILQNLYYLTNGQFIATKAELLECLEGKNRAVLKQALDLSSGISHDFDKSFQLLFSWCQETLYSL